MPVVAVIVLALIGAILVHFFKLILAISFIAVAAVVGSATYGFLALLERRAAFWHPSFRHGT